MPAYKLDESSPRKKARVEGEDLTFVVEGEEEEVMDKPMVEPPLMVRREHARNKKKEKPFEDEV